MFGLKRLKSAGILSLTSVVAVLVFALSAGETSDVQRHDNPAQAGPGEAVAGELPDKKEKKIKYWVAPMDPTYIRNEPGKSPMGMDLVPVYEDGSEESEAGTVRIDPVTVQNMGVRTARVSRGPIKTAIRTIGRITYDEERVEHIHTKISGWVEQLFVKTSGENIVEGQPILSIYSPELVATAQEYLQALDYREKISESSIADVVSGAETLIESTRNRLLLMDLSPEQIRSIEERGEVQREMILRSQTSGIVIRKNVFEGMKVTPGMELFTIADLSRVWVIASVYEYELPFLSVGQETVMSLPYEPGTAYQGKVTFIYPYLSPKTRTVEVRMEFDNPDLKLKPDMYTDVLITSKTKEDVLRVPSEAILRTGYRDIVITSPGDNKFLPKEVRVGPEGEDMTRILSGLEEGEIIVTSGQFLIDSESNLREAINKMLEARSAEPADEADRRESAMKKVEETEAPEEPVDHDRGKAVSGLIENYIRIHAALVSESVSEVAAESRSMSGELEKIQASDKAEKFRDITVPLEDSLPGLMSGDLQMARDSFKALSRVMIGLVKSSGREYALSSGVKVYFCPMAEERWMQRGAELKNPYLGEDMLICGTEEKL
jgi:multidrug efflux pump subunit AcrA (membrane-fusion protein)